MFKYLIEQKVEYRASIQVLVWLVHVFDEISKSRMKHGNDHAESSNE